MPQTYTLQADMIAGDLPCLSVAQEDLNADAPLALVLHTLGGRKEKMLPSLYALASLGCRAVAPDARLHGQRAGAESREARLQTDFFAATAEMIEGTAQDVSRLLDHFGAPRAGIHGISLGGYSAFAALASEPRLACAAVALGSPDWLEPMRGAGLGPGHPLYDRAAALNPLARLPDTLPPRPLLMLHGTDDAVVSPGGVLALEQRLRPLYAAHPERLELGLFPGLGHHYTDEMLFRTTDWFRRFLLSAR